MVEVKLPCVIGSIVKDKDDGSEWCIVGYKIISNGIPFRPSPHKVLAEAVDIHNQDNRVLIYSDNGVFPDSIEILGY